MQTDNPSATTSSIFSSWKVEHAGIRVPDFQAAITWYTEKLDFRVTHTWAHGDMKLALVTPASDAGFSFELLAAPGAANRLPYEDLGASLKQSGWHHISIHVDNVDDTIAELRNRGVTIVSEPRDVLDIGCRFAFFSDPWDNLFEVIQSINK